MESKEQIERREAITEIARESGRSVEYIEEALHRMEREVQDASFGELVMTLHKNLHYRPAKRVRVSRLGTRGSRKFDKPAARLRNKRARRARRKNRK